MHKRRCGRVLQESRRLENRKLEIMASVGGRIVQRSVLLGGCAAAGAGGATFGGSTSYGEFIRSLLPSAFEALLPAAGATAQSAVASVAEMQAIALKTSAEALQALLFRPVQRMCQYPLLFKQALKHLEKGSELHARFTEVFDTVETTIAQVNEGVRRADEQARTTSVILHVADLKAKEKECLLSASNTLVHEACLDMKLILGRVAWGPQWKIRRAYKWCVTTT